MKNTRWYIAAAIVLLAVIAGVYMRGAHNGASTSAQQRSTQRTIQLNGNAIRVSVASTPAEREQGLSGRTGLAPDEGMLFVFQQDGDYAFWMKDMLFSIDMVWIDSTGKIIYIAPSVSPETYPTAVDPHMNALYVLELPAGYAAEHDVVVGDQAQI